mmetsp:Transcript_8697/g.16987  ORF Transcript_8697/g.16987 Transcript_8697/m.16987 type:complete len:419 (-) Transcript_8697:20-1276(-)
MPSTNKMELLHDALDLLSKDSTAAVAQLQSIIGSSKDAKVLEEAMLGLGKWFASQALAEELAQLLRDVRPAFKHLPKAKTAKVVRSLIESASSIPASELLQIGLCEESIEWCRNEKLSFLRQRLETKLAALLMDTERFKEALDVITLLLKEVKRLDDKQQLVEIQLLESKIYHKLENVPRAKAALTSARSCANAIYCPPALQAEIDIMAGILHSEERDYRTAYSYFYESHEGFASVDDARALPALKYMLLCKIMMQRPEDVFSLITSKGGVKYAGRDMDSMKAVAHALKLRSLNQFQQELVSFRDELEGDEVVNHHITALYETMLEQHLCRCIEPFSKVELEHIASLVGLPQQQVLEKLSQMILDKKFEGTLDQGSGCLLVFDDSPLNELYQSTLDHFQALNTVVDSLFEEALVANSS